MIGFIMNVFIKGFTMPKKIINIQEKIVQAARSILFEKGLEGLSLRSVAAKCDIAVGTIYNYYKDKEALMAAVMSEDWKNDLRQMVQKTESALSIEEGITAIFETLRGFCDQYEGIWASYSGGPGFILHFQRGHQLLCEQIVNTLHDLFARFSMELKESGFTLLADTLINAAMIEDINSTDVLFYIQGFLKEREHV
jgi:AcrR family transcriptional regulator